MACMGKTINSHKSVTDKPHRTIPPDKPRCEWDVIKMDLKDMGCEVANKIV
jgi:hypothetical protein